ncbi:unnamed protein product [Citrullus colocynthis]|uniref:DRBM domain-containing protein n=1 Tax=Citrullus colocynthis TaxID=252529 RepID=A0ABP0XWD2_9ROSI
MFSLIVCFLFLPFSRISENVMKFYLVMLFIQSPRRNLFKTQLEELCRCKSRKLPKYFVVKQGQDQDPHFEATATVDGEQLCPYTNSRKSSKQAHNSAAKLLSEQLCPYTNSHRLVCTATATVAAAETVPPSTIFATIISPIGTSLHSPIFSPVFKYIFLSSTTVLAFTIGQFWCNT